MCLRWRFIQEMHDVWDGVYFVVEVLVDSADWLENVDRWRCVLVLLEPGVQQRRVVCIFFDDAIHQPVLVGRYDSRDWSVAIFLTQEHLHSIIWVITSYWVNIFGALRTKQWHVLNVDLNCNNGFVPASTLIKFMHSKQLVCGILYWQNALLLIPFTDLHYSVTWKTLHKYYHNYWLNIARSDNQ